MDGRGGRDVCAVENGNACLTIDAHDIRDAGQPPDVGGRQNNSPRPPVDARNRHVPAGYYKSALRRRDSYVCSGQHLKAGEIGECHRAADCDTYAIAVSNRCADAGCPYNGDANAHGFTTVTVPESTVLVNIFPSIHLIYHR